MKERPVDIIIPIYNAYDDLKICIESIIKYTDLEYNRLILVNDNSTDERIRPYLSCLQNNNIIVLDNTENMGFSHNINLGMQQSNENDVIWLNSDTILTKNWIEKLKNCAYSNEAIATVTPLSNNATLCSVPIAYEENWLPEHFSVDEMAELVESCSLHRYPEITTGHGFCMYVKREVIQKIGYLDEEAFGRGYGEENDFCYRAEQNGYYNAMCDDTYIYHTGTKSFVSKDKQNYIDEHIKILKKRYPKQFRANEIAYRDRPNADIAENVKIYYQLRNGNINEELIGTKGEKRCRNMILKLICQLTHRQV